MRLSTRTPADTKNGAGGGKRAGQPHRGRYRTDVTERTGVPGDPADDPYRHLFRDEPPGEPNPGTNPDQPQAVLSGADDFFDDDSDVAAESTSDGNQVEVVPGADYFHAPQTEPSGDDQPSDDTTYEADAAYGDGTFAVEHAPTPTPAAEAAEPAAREVETGRLFRSAEADPATEAIPALRGDERRRLRTVGPHSKTAATSTPVAERAAPEPGPRDAARSRLRDGGSPKKGRRGKRADSSRSALPAAVPSGPGLRAIGVFVVVIAVTLLLGLVDVLLGGGLGPIFGVGLLLSSAYGAFAVRRDDAIYAITAPPIAALLTVITVGQINVSASSSSLTGRVIASFFALADNWIWVIGSTLLALIIVAVRSVRAKRG